MEAFIAVRKGDSNANAVADKCYEEHGKLSSQHSKEAATNDSAPSEKASMPDIEGTYLMANRNGFLVRTEAREEWDTYCNEAARISNGQEEFSRVVKPYDRVRLSGITYNPTTPKDRISHCMAESVTILGPSK